MKVLKFGGTSVGSAERIKNVAKLIAPRGRNIVVLSAMSGTTNTLVEIADYLSRGNVDGAKETINSLEKKYIKVVSDLFGGHPEGDLAMKRIADSLQLIRSFTNNSYTKAEKIILAQGEIISTALMYHYLISIGVSVYMADALDFMRMNSNDEPELSYISDRLVPILNKHNTEDIILTQGYICRNAKGGIDNLQRGGSDLTASLIGAAINAEEIEIWTDIDGMHNNDPRFVSGTKPVGHLDFEEAAELAYFGAKILHPACVLPAKLNNIPVRLLNTMQPDAPGTLIDNSYNNGSSGIKAVAAKDGITAIRIKSGRKLMSYGFLHKVFETFEDYRTPIDMIATSEVGVSVTLDSEENLGAIIDDLKEFATVTVDRNMVIICVVGDLEWTNLGLEAKTIDAIKDFPIRMISYGGSENNISFLINQEDKVPALNALSKKLFNN